jgi:biotin carboxyl carrier protein
MAYKATLGDQTYTISVHELDEHQYKIVIDDEEHIIDGRQLTDHMYSLLVEHQSFTVDVAEKDDDYIVAYEGKSFQVGVLDERKARRGGAGASLGGADEKEVCSMMPGKVVELLAQVGDAVEKDQGVIIIEAMKMENEIRVPVAGTVKAIHVEAGQTVESGELLVELE